MHMRIPSSYIFASLSFKVKYVTLFVVVVVVSAGVTALLYCSVERV